MAWENKNYRMNIIINLPNGVYLLGSESGTGKTYLANWLKKMNGYGEPVVAIRGDIERVPDSLHKLDLTGCKVFMFDDYTLYNGDVTFAKELAELGKNMIVLVDCKVKAKIDGPVKYAYVSLRSEHEIYVGR